MKTAFLYAVQCSRNLILVRTEVTEMKTSTLIFPDFPSLTRSFSVLLPITIPSPLKRCYAPVKYRYSYASCICGKQSGILRILYSATQNSPVEFFPHSSEPVECGINRLPILPRQPYSQNGYRHYSYRRE